MALKFSLAVVVFVAAAVAGDIGEEFCGCFGDDVAKNLGLAPLKSDFDRTWTDPPKMLLSCVAAGD